MKPDRNKLSKFYIPPSVFNGKYYPQYVYGGAYLVADYAVKPLLDRVDNYESYIINIEDIFVNGLVAEKAGVKRYSSSYLNFFKDCSKLCQDRKTRAVFMCRTDEKIRKSWDKQQKDKNCLIK